MTTAKNSRPKQSILKDKQSVLKIIEFGNPLLRHKAKTLKADQIRTKSLAKLIDDMNFKLTTKKLGVGLAAPQIGESLALTVIRIRPLPHRPNVKPCDLVMINPQITDTFGRKKAMWEGCISSGPLKSSLFAKVPRYQRIKVRYYDEKAKPHHKIFTGLPAQVIQHEIDHLNGILFVDKVIDTTSYTSYSEYRKLVKRTNRESS